MSEAAPRNLGRHVAAASLFMIGLRMCFRMIGVVSTLILVRLLAPTDFGIVGLAMAVASGLDLLTEASLGMALIRLPEMTRAHLDTAFTFQILRGLLIGLVLASTAGLAASWMNEPRVRPIMWVLSATAIVQGFENI
ncbi:MAG: oligosaccharide flippase family protein, partial [Acetobacteraceae bacterium]|nr:oligosaccharide flippase family protein [Acetobacteraceae bacterium]